MSPRRCVGSLGVALAVGFLSLAATPLHGQGTGDSPLAPFAWMPGCWEGTLSNGALYEEWWMPEGGGLMQGIARMTREGRTITFEFMVLRVENGTPVFMGQPANASTPTRFPLSAREGERWVFENPEHDFPQRVIYANPAAGSAPFARIEGTTGGGERSLEFPLERVACPG